MLERIREIPGKVLSLEEYQEEFAKYWQDFSGEFNKLERLQTFEEAYDPSWRAFMAGHWDEVVQLSNEDAQKEIVNVKRDNRRIDRRRVRVVELPVSAYLQWELYYLQLLVPYGNKVRVISPEAVTDYEKEALVPELVIFGSSLMYEVLYTSSGALCGARRITDTVVIEQTLPEIAQLYRSGEDLLPFYHREIAPLSPPPAASGW